MENIRIIFVVPEKFSNKNECSEVMHSAFEVCKQNVNTNVSWILESKFKPARLNKTDFVVFEEFEGKMFEELKSTKNAIVGPWAVTICLMKGQPIPNFDWPIYNVAMYDCIVTCSHLPKNIKLEMKTKIELMGGCYVDSLLEKNTHLITGSAKSEKYLIAAEAGVKLMCTSWVEKVWEVSQNNNVHADDDQFKSHCCLAFHNLVISSTGITNPVEKLKLEKMIKANGGTFTGKLNLKNTDILIGCGDVTLSDKYKAARQNPHIKCVDIQWVTDSVAKGYALPHHLYQVKKITSTPTKFDKAVNPEFSILSVIGGLNTSQQTSVDESIATFSPRQSDRVKSFKRKAKDYYEDLVDNLDIKKAKKAGQYLDGCSVYLIGFSTDHTEKLNKIINLSGATRYDNFSDRVTHVIVGDTSTHEMTLIKNKNTSAVLLSVHWLIDSIEEGHPVSEEKYLIITQKDNSQLGSPLSKKGLSLLRANRTATEKEIELSNTNNNDDEEDEEMHGRPSRKSPSNINLLRLNEKEIALNMNNNDKGDEDVTTKNSTGSNISDTLGKLLEGIDNTNLTKAAQIYELPQATPQFQPSETSTQHSSISVTQDAESEMDRVFENIKFLIIGFDEEEFEKLKESVLELGGEVVSKTYKGIPDFALVPIFNQKELHNTTSEVVNDLFIADCMRERELILSIPYYHRPFDLPDAKPLENCVVTISSYTGTERVFLKNLIEALGGLAQEQFSRIRQESKNLLPSTHLVSPEPAGKKYEAALKWGLPVVCNKWLLECAKTGKRVYEGDYLLGDSKAVDRRENSTENTLRKDKSLMELQKTTSTPTSSPGPSRLSKVLTPVNQVTPYHKRFLNSAEKFSQVTPVNKIMKQFRESNLNSSVTAKESESNDYTVPQPWAFVKTPNTPLGACLTPNPSSSLKKQCAYWLQQIPDKGSPQSNKSTPISELKRQLWEKVAKMNGDKLDFSESGEGTKLQENEDGTNKEIISSEAEDTPEKRQLADRLKQLEDLLSASDCGRRQSRNFKSTIPVAAGTAEFQDTQPCSVVWDFKSQEERKSRHRMFSLSGIADDSERARMVQQIEQLGGTVSSLANYDPACTHLICPKAGRNEKTLSCMAAGKWILHSSYLEKSVEVGYLVNEEEYEFGNPKSVGRFPSPGDTEFRMQKMHWWRKEVARRGYGAFNDMRAIIVANKREPIVRVVEAGGGVVIDMEPPFDDTIHATHCLLEQKSVKKIEDYIPLAKQGIYLVNTVYISDYLYQPNKNIKECILPYFSKYYGRS